jgi:phosphoserine phosphatase
LESAMHARGANTRVLLRCTHLEERHGRCTGRVIGQAMCGLAKASAVRRLANQRGWDLTRCFAYGDSAGDRCMLSCVGHPAAVNPSPALRCIARRHGWPVVVWRGESPSDARGLVERSQARLKTPLEMR